MAATLYERSDYEEAVTHYREALALRADDAELRGNLAMRLVDPVIAPADLQSYFAEKLVQLPYRYQPSEARAL